VVDFRDSAVVAARNGHSGLVTLHLADLVKLLDVVAYFNVPLLDGNLGDALANVGQLELQCGRGQV
jgi:hypothetical protein